MTKKSRQSSLKVFASDLSGVRDSGGHCAEAVTEQTRRLDGEGRAKPGPKDSVLSVSQRQTGLEWRG